MPKSSGTADTGNGHDEGPPTAGSDDQVTAAQSDNGNDNGNDVVVATATVGVICIGAALFEAALIPGMVIGVAAMLVPKALPKLGTAVEPMFRGAVRGTYKLGQKARHIMAEAEEQVHDIVAEENAAEPAEKRPG
jgi:hypothetical protein